MGRPRKSVAEMEANGAWKVNPERQRVALQAGEFDSRPPRHFDADKKKIWKELVAKVPTGILASADSLSLELACSLLNRFRKAEDDPTLVGLMASELAQLRALLESLGCTPAGRNKLAPTIGSKKQQLKQKALEQTGENNPLAKFLLPPQLQ